jgi:hypothetical protein
MGQSSLCENGVRDGIVKASLGEECDEMSTFNDAGCDVNCRVTTDWMCATVSEGATDQTCCQSHLNPYDNALDRVCRGQACEALTNLALGYTIQWDCSKHDVNECLQTNTCPTVNTVCHNLDSTNGTVADPMVGHECTCPPDKYGDKDFCSSSEFKTSFTIQSDGTKTDVDIRAAVTLLASVNDNHEKYTAGTPDAGGNINYSVEYLSRSAEAMRNLTAQVLGNPFGAGLVLDAGSVRSAVQLNGRGLTNTVVGGLAYVVDTFKRNVTTGRWSMTFNYEPGLVHSVASPYISRIGKAKDDAAFTNTMAQSFLISKFPCVDVSPAVFPTPCCLQEYRDEYYVGAFGDNITAMDDGVASCSAHTQTLNLFEWSSGDEMVKGLLDDVPDSTVTSDPANKQFTLHLSTDDITEKFAMKTPLEDSTGFKLRFFVGMNYISLLRDNEYLMTTASQIEFQISITPSLTFSFANEQSYSFVDRLNLQVVDTMYIDTVDLVTRHLQHVTMQVQIPNTYQVDPDGLFPTGSLRFAIADQIPDPDSPLWQNPCMTDDTMAGFMDTSAGQSWNTLYGGNTPLSDRYSNAMSQSCSTAKTMCINPTTIDQGLVEFTFPIGADAITQAMLESQGKRIFVTFLVSVIDDSDKKRFADVSAEAPLLEASMSAMCTQWEGELTLDKLTEVDMMVGLIKDDSDWNSSVSEYTDILDSNRLDGSDLVAGANRDNLIDLGAKHTSASSSLITLSIKPKIGLSTAFSNAHYITIDSYMSMHFLDEARYLEVYSKFQVDNTAPKPYTETISNGYTQLAFNNEVTTMCGTGYECGIRYGIGNGKALGNAAHSFTNEDAVGPFTTNDADAANFITSNLLTNSQFSNELAMGMTTTVKTRKGLDDAMKRAWYINPTFSWKRVGSDETNPYLTDYMIGVAAISLRDNAGAIVRRRLLSMHNGPKPSQKNRRSEGNTSTPESRLAEAVEKLKGSPIVGGAPALKFNSNLTQTILSIFSLAPEQGYAFVDLRFQITSVESNKELVAETISKHVKDHQAKFCPTCLQLYPVFTNVILSQETTIQSRRLLTTGNAIHYEVSTLIAHI